MFDELLKELKRLEQTTKVFVPIHSDEMGYVDRQCPAENCEFLLKFMKKTGQTASKMRQYGAHSAGMRHRPTSG